MNLLHKFLATDRWLLLIKELRDSSYKPTNESVSVFSLVAAISILCITPVLIFTEKTVFGTNGYISTLAMILCAIAAVALRLGVNISIPKPAPLLKSLKLTHTAIALGCIPAVIVILLSPDIIGEHQSTIKEAMTPKAKGTVSFLTILKFFGTVTALSAWAAVSEELIYRYSLISIARRIPFFSSQIKRDIFAVTLSAITFGIAHSITWGIPAALALTGLGLGFSLAYLATKEAIAPVIIYHFLFDFISISIALLI